MDALSRVGCEGVVSNNQYEVTCFCRRFKGRWEVGEVRLFYATGKQEYNNINNIK